MTPAEISIAATRLLADVQTLAQKISDALTKPTDKERSDAWRASADALGSVISDIATLAKNDSVWALAIGGTSAVDALKVSYDKALDVYTKTGNINNVEVSDILGVMGGVSDLAGGLLFKPGPQFAAGIALKGLGLGAAMGQNAVGDMTVGQLIGASPSDTPTEAPSTAMEVVIADARVVSLTITPPHRQRHPHQCKLHHRHICQ